MDEKVKISELKKGDIILYEGLENDELDQIIMLATNSKVTHTAIFDYVKDGLIYVAEENIPHAVVAETNNRMKTDDIHNRIGRNAHVLRRKDSEKLFKGKEKNPVSIAEYYAEEPALEFGYYSFLPIAIYMLGDKAIQNGRYKAIVMDVLELAMMELIQWTNPKGSKGHPMSCSQFAFHCFKEAGAEYELTLKTDERDKLIEDIIKLLLDNKSSLLALDKDELMTVSVLADDKKQEKIQNVLTNLKEYREMEKKGTLTDENESESDEASFLNTLFQFLKVFIQRLEENFNIKDLNPIKLIELIYSDMYEYFIAPGDVFTAVNLEHLGIIDYDSTES